MATKACFSTPCGRSRAHSCSGNHREAGPEEDGAGLTALGLGFGVFAPAASSDAEKPVEAVIVFEAGYYETGTL